MNEYLQVISGTIQGVRVLGKALIFVDVPIKQYGLVNVCLSARELDQPTLHLMADRPVSSSHIKPALLPPKVGDVMRFEGHWGQDRVVRGQTFPTFKTVSASWIQKAPETERGTQHDRRHWWPDDYEPEASPKKKRKIRSGKVKHSRRAEPFADWIADTLKESIEVKESLVIDVAGGRGDLSLCLLERGINSIVIDPRVVKKPNKKRRKRLLKVGKNCIPQIEALVDWEEEQQRKYWEGCTFVAGLHPDQATEQLVEGALLFNKSFAVVPCCVFPKLHPDRRLSDDSPVISTEDFCQYLAEKTENAGREVHTFDLDIEGASMMVYSLV